MRIILITTDNNSYKLKDYINLHWFKKNSFSKVYIGQMLSRFLENTVKITINTHTF